MVPVKARLSIAHYILRWQKNLTTKESIIDPKNPSTVGTSLWNLGNHTLSIMFIMTIVWVIWVSYQ